LSKTELASPPERRVFSPERLLATSLSSKLV
jgi:hypothetical protein